MSTAYEKENVQRKKRKRERKEVIFPFIPSSVNNFINLSPSLNIHQSFLPKSHLILYKQVIETMPHHQI